MRQQDPGEEEKEEEEEETKLAACGNRNRKQKSEKCDVDQNKRIVSHRQDNVNSNTIGSIGT